jgi:hypothetical protein
LARDRYQTKEGNEAVLTTMKMETETIRRRRSGGIGSQRTSCKYGKVLRVNPKAKRRKKWHGVLPAVLRSSEASHNRRRSTKRRNPSLVLELGLRREWRARFGELG